MAETWKQWEGTIVDGKFRLERFLGGSEHSVVFLTETESGAKAAIKFVPAIPQALDFKRSAWEQSSRLSHPHLIRLFGSGQCRLGNLDVVYAVTEYAEENAAQLLPNRALSADEAREMLKPVLESLKYLHEKGLVHGSLRPTNVLAVQDQLKLSIDQVRAFGKPGLAQDSSIYAAPEVAAEGARPPSDIWSLGTTLIEVLTQRVPERSSSGKPVMPAGLPELFGEIASHCLAEPPQDRWTLAQIRQRLGGSAPQAKSAKESTAAAVVAPAASVAERPIPKTPATSEPVRDSIPAELGSGRRLMVSGISFLLVLVAIYVGTQLFHRPSHGDANAPVSSVAPTENTNSSRTPAVPPATATPATAAPESSAPNTPAAKPAAPESPAASAPGRVLERAEPNVSASARATITGKIRVRVNLAVDETGKVSDARFITPGPSHYFSGRAMDAARRWTFVPPQANGQPAPSKWVVSFTFTRKGTDSSAEESQP
jgi:TonB family protein